MMDWSALLGGNRPVTAEDVAEGTRARSQVDWNFWNKQAEKEWGAWKQTVPEVQWINEDIGRRFGQYTGPQRTYLDEIRMFQAFMPMIEEFRKNEAKERFTDPISKRQRFRTALFGTLGEMGYKPGQKERFTVPIEIGYGSRNPFTGE